MNPPLLFATPGDLHGPPFWGRVPDKCVGDSLMEIGRFFEDRFDSQRRISGQRPRGFQIAVDRNVQPTGNPTKIRRPSRSRGKISASRWGTHLTSCFISSASGRTTDWPDGIFTHWRSPTFHGVLVKGDSQKSSLF